MSADRLTHLAPCHAEFVTQHPKTIRAYCGTVVPETALARNGDPTCEECRRIDEEDSRQLALMQAYDPESESEASR